MPTRIPYHRPASASIPTDADAAARERKRFYGLKRWEDTRDLVLARNPLCVRCTAKGETALAKVVHHIKDRLKHPELAFRLDNLEGLCNPCHTSHHKRK